MRSRSIAALSVVALLASGCGAASPPVTPGATLGPSDRAQETPAPSPDETEAATPAATSPQETTFGSSPPSTEQAGGGDFHLILTGSQVDSEFDARGVEQTNTTKANLEITFRAVQPDFSILELEGGTVSVSDVQTGVCTGSSKFSGTITVPSDPVHTVTTGDGHSSGDGNLDVVVNDGNDGFSTVPYEGGQAVYVTLVLSLAYDATCPSGNGPTGETIASCRGDGDSMSGLVLLRTESGDFVGSCHEDIGGETHTGTTDWNGEARQGSSP